MGLFKIKNTIPVKFFTLAAVLITSFCLAIIWLYNINRNHLFEDRHQMVKNQVETAYGILDHYGSQAKAGTLAKEVRNLAARSAKAARETADLIQGSVDKAKNGADIADRTSEALNKILRGVGKVTELIGEIAVDSNDQAERIYQINREIGQIDQITQSNTANAEETASTAEQLASQTTYLEGLLDNFKVDEEACETFMVERPSGEESQRRLPTV